MTVASGADRNRMTACRACGNRVPRTARRCAACGTRDPGRPGPVTSAPRTASRRATRRGRGLLVAVVVLLLAAGGAVIAAVLIWGPPPPAPPLERRPDTRPAPAAPARTTPAERAPAPSRSRGRTDWLFFFRPGDRLARMGEETPLGEIVRTDNAHAFPDGTTGPAYVLRTPSGEERTVDADELETSARVQ
jgi:hypothetical protein